MAFAGPAIPLRVTHGTLPGVPFVGRRGPYLAGRPSPVVPCRHRREPGMETPPPPGDKPDKVKGIDKAGAALDDFINKKYGRGYIFYGERARDNVDNEKDEGTEEFAFDGGPSARIPDGPPVLVIGATSPVGTWITLKLRTAGLPVRILSRSVKAAEAVFGPSGANVTMTPGSITDATAVAGALEGCRAVVVAVSGGIGSYKAVDHVGVANVAAAAAAAGPDVSRVVLLSRAEGVDGPLERLGGKQAAVRAGEAALQATEGVSWTIVRAGRLTDLPGGRLRVEVTPPSEGKRGERKRGVSRMDVAEAVAEALVVEAADIAEAGGREGVRYGNALVEVVNGEEEVREGEVLDWASVYQQLGQG
ncbi:hypothetical protein MMPV_009536 [Pyropia vietnamensis]